MEPSREAVLSGLGSAAMSALAQLFVAGLILVLPTVALSRLELASRNTLVDTFGFKAVLWTGWIGVPIHEMSHYLACRIFGHRVEGISLFSPDPRTGTLGYVNHTWDEASRWQSSGNFFIGIAPVFGGMAAIMLLMALVLPDARLLWSGNQALTEMILDPGWPTICIFFRHYALELPTALLSAETLLSIRVWLALYLIMCIGLHMSPSREDMHGTWIALVCGVTLVFLVNLVAAPFGGIPAPAIDLATRAISPLVTGLLLALAANIVSLAIILFLVRIAMRHRRSS